MTIKGVSDQIQLPRKGIIRIGEKKVAKNGKEYPVSLDHFVGPPEIHEMFGPEPKEIPVHLPFETVDLNYDENLKAYKNGGKLFCRGNGQTATRSDGKGGMIELECPFQECSFYKKKECKQVGVLNFIIREISPTSAYQIWTSSRNSMTNIRSTLTLLYDMFGKLSGIPMILKVQKQKAHPWVKDKSGEMKQVTTEVSVITIECALPFETIRVLASRKNLLMTPDKTLDNDTYPETLYLPEENKPVEKEDDGGLPPFDASEEVEVLNPLVEKFLNYESII